MDEEKRKTISRDISKLRMQQKKMERESVKKEIQSKELMKQAETTFNDKGDYNDAFNEEKGNLLLRKAINTRNASLQYKKQEAMIDGSINNINNNLQMSQVSESLLNIGEVLKETSSKSVTEGLRDEFKSFENNSYNFNRQTEIVENALDLQSTISTDEKTKNSVFTKDHEEIKREMKTKNDLEKILPTPPSSLNNNNNNKEDEEEDVAFELLNKRFQTLKADMKITKTKI